MFIIHSDGLGLTNMDNVCEMVASGRYIHAYCVNGSHHPVAVYESPDKAIEALKWLSEQMSTTKSNVLVME